MSRVKMYGTRTCPYCRMADRLFEKKGVVVEHIQVDELPARREEMMNLSNSARVPQIFVDDHHVGGYEELVELDRSGALDALLARAAQ